MDGERAITRLGIFGGTFDPIHNGHLAAAEEVLARFELDRVLFVPAGSPWQKEGFSAAEDRWTMTVLAMEDHPRFEASRVEIDRRGPTYSVDTLTVLRDFHGPDVALYFIAGLDAVLTLGTWHGVEDFGATAEVIAVTRPGYEPADLQPRAGWPAVTYADIPPLDVSSTEIRARVGEGLDIDSFVPPGVARYIYDRGLYRSEPVAAGRSA